MANHEKDRHEQWLRSSNSGHTNRSWSSNERSPCKQVKQQWQQRQKLEQQRYACPWHTQSGQSTTHGTGWHLPVSRARLAQPSFGSVAQSSTDRACRSASLAHSPPPVRASRESCLRVCVGQRRAPVVLL